MGPCVGPVLDDSCGFSDGSHLFHLFRRQLQGECFFQGEHKIEMLRGVPGFDGLRRRIGRDPIHRNTEKV